MSLSLGIITLDSPAVDTWEVYGWGDDGNKTTIKGEVRDITIIKDGKSYVGIRLSDDGSLHLTCYQGGFTQYIHGLELKNTRPWKE